MTYHGCHIRLISEEFQSHTAIVTPDLAQEWLDTAARNRPVSAAVIKTYAVDMRENKWHFTGEPIAFDKLGRLIDGQHRLRALAQQEITHALEFVIHVGLEPEAQLSMDQGRKRSPGQQLGLMGYTNPTTLGGGVRLLMGWESDRLFTRSWDEKNVVTTAAILEWAESHPVEVECAAQVFRSIRNIGILPAVGTAFALRLGKAYPETIQDFFKQMEEMVGLAKGSPLLTFNHRLQRARNERLRLTQADQLGFLIVTWNHWSENLPLHRLVRPHGGEWTQDNFPVLDV